MILPKFDQFSNWYDDLFQLVRNLEKELQEYEQTSGYNYPVHKPATAQVLYIYTCTCTYIPLHLQADCSFYFCHSHTFTHTYTRVHTHTHTHTHTHRLGHSVLWLPLCFHLWLNLLTTSSRYMYMYVYTCTCIPKYWCYMYMYNMAYFPGPFNHSIILKPFSLMWYKECNKSALKIPLTFW